MWPQTTIREKTHAKSAELTTETSPEKTKERPIDDAGRKVTELPVEPPKAPEDTLEPTEIPFEFVARNPDGSIKTRVRLSEAGDVLLRTQYGADGEERTAYTYDSQSKLLRMETFHNGLKIGEEIFR